MDIHKKRYFLYFSFAKERLEFEHSSLGYKDHNQDWFVVRFVAGEAFWFISRSGNNTNVVSLG